MTDIPLDFQVMWLYIVCQFPEMPFQYFAVLFYTYNLIYFVLFALYFLNLYMKLFMRYVRLIYSIGIFYNYFYYAQ